MNALQFNAHDLCISRWCQARDCPHDALPGWGLCQRHDRLHRLGREVILHVVPDRLPDMLRCSDCNQWKTDDEFPMKPEGERSGGGRRADRRGRYYQCLACGDPVAVQIREFRAASLKRANANPRPEATR